MTAEEATAKYMQDHGLGFNDNLKAAVVMDDSELPLSLAARYVREDNPGYGLRVVPFDGGKVLLLVPYKSNKHRQTTQEA